MNEILEMLYKYSASYRPVDKDFYDFILSLYWNGLKGYLENIRYEDIEQDVDDLKGFIPMQYVFLEKKISIDEKIIEKNFVNFMLQFQRAGLNEFDRFLAYNSACLIILLHEIGHANLYKKGALNDGSFEGELFHLCYYPEIEVSSRNLLIICLKFFSSLKMFEGISKINEAFDCAAPDERLVDITSFKQVLGLLEVFNEDIKKIPKILEFFRTKTYRKYMVGYDINNLENGPLVHYINELKKINSPKLNIMITSLEKRYSEITIIDDKIKYGLDVTNWEINDLKRRILK